MWRRIVSAAVLVLTASVYAAAQGRVTPARDMVPTMTVDTLTLDIANQDVSLSRAAANILQLAAGDSFNLNPAGVRLSSDGDGALTILGLGDGADENWTINLDDFANEIRHLTSTGVTHHNYLVGLAVANETEGGTGRFTRLTSRDAVTLSGATTDSTTITIPSGAKIHGCSFNVNTAVVDDAGDDTWSAAFITGSTTALATGAAAAQDTKVDTMVVDEIASATTQIRFTPNGGNFAAGVIEVVCYYETLTSLAGV